MLLAASAVITALSAQILTVTQISTGDLLAVEAWYQRRINIRGPLTVAATVLLVAAAGASTVAAGLALLGIPDQPPTIAITRTTPLQTNSATSARPQAVGAVTAEVTFRGLDPGATATVTIRSGRGLLAQAAFTAGPDGTAARILTAQNVPAIDTVMVDAAGDSWTCTSRLVSGMSDIALTCGSRG